MSDNDQKYLIDSDVLISIKARDDSDHIYSEVGKLIEAEKVKTVRQVYKEVLADSVVKGWITPLKDKVVLPPELQYTSGVQKKLGILTEHTPHLWPQTGGTAKDPADPWLVAVASIHGFCIVTNENMRSPKKIPAACKLDGLGCGCISGPHFLYLENIVTEIDPAHISPKEFFGD